MEVSYVNRILPIEGGYNFRDLGGLITMDNKQIQPDLLIRTDELSNLTTKDLELLAAKNVKTIVDFRTSEERKTSIDKVPSTCENQIHMDIMAANMNAFMEKIQNGNSDFKTMMTEFYSDLVTCSVGIKEFKRFFSILQNPKHTSVVYHCTAGKDRTGIATALILSALNVDFNTIEEDYLLSNQFLSKKYAHYLEEKPSLADIFLVKEEYLHHAFETIQLKYYSVEDFLTDILYVDLDLMKCIYTK